MPALPGKASKRRTPRRKLDADDVWNRKFNQMGFAPLSNDKSTAMATADNISSPFPSPSDPSLARGSEKKKLTIFDLPSETQKDIFKHSNTPDLISLSLVSKHFRGIASEQLYRTFHIVFPDEEDPSNDVPIDGLAGGLDTFVTSEYNYANYLREIILESLSGGEKGERAYRHYLYDVSCGKFMNTLLLLTLRKAKALETFKWDIRVELSREVFKALHRIQSLQHLHLRMQAGRSIYQSPPALFDSHTNNNPSLGFSSTNLVNSFILPGVLSNKNHRKDIKSASPPTLSGFTELKTLAILDLDALEYTSEIKKCITNCSSTLSSLRLSFSDALAKQSRKPPPEIISDDESDQEDEFQVGLPQDMPPGIPPPLGQGPTGIADPNGPSKAIKALEQKKNQELFLSKIFGLESSPALKQNAPPSPVIESEHTSLSVVALRKKFLKTLAPIVLKLFSTAKDDDYAGTEEAEVFEIMRKFAEIQDNYEKPKDNETQQQLGSLGSSTAKTTPESSIDGKIEPEGLASGSGDEPGLFDEPSSQKIKDKMDPDTSNPDDIDIEEPEGQELAIDSESIVVEQQTDKSEKIQPESKPENDSVDLSALVSAKTAQFLEKHAALRRTTQELASNTQLLKQRIEQLKANFYAGKSADNPYATLEIEAAEEIYDSHKQRLEEVTRTLQDFGDQVEDITNDHQTAIGENKVDEMSDYVRKTRGLTLETLALYLIPIKASVLSKAIDLSVLRSVTLLNVGFQTSFWNIMAKQNRASPLPLHKIHTDHVSIPFLKLVSELATLTELFLLERTLKAKAEAMATKTAVTIDDIRRIVLKRHAATLKILMIRNDAGQEWDMNIKTAILLCQRAKALEELAVSFGVRAMHTLLQFMPGLVSLRALHTINFRTDDRCTWVMYEFRKFTVDNISHSPHMKLEYIAVDHAVERLVRRVSKKKKPTTKGKGKENTTKLLTQSLLGSWPDGMTMNSGLGTGFGTSGLDSMNLSESEDEDTVEWGTGISGKIGLKVETVEGIRFSDITSVRIFEKDILGGRL